MKSKLLIVEDESISAMNFEKFLNSSGFNVVGIADTGEDAVRKAAESRPDLVLMDIVLKGDMDGIEAATLILKDYDIPVVYLTAHPEEDVVNRAKKTSPYGYIIKPSNKTDLKNAVNMALYKHSMELKLKENEAKYRTLFDSAPHYNILIDTDGKILDLNNTLARALSCNKYDLTGLFIWDLKIFQEEEGLFQEKIRQVLKGRTVEPFEHKFSSVDCGDKWISLQLTPLIIKGEVSSILCIAHNVTGIKQAEERVRENEDALINAQKLGKIGSFHYDFNKNIEHWSLNLYHMFKIDQDEVIGFDELFKYIIPEDHFKLMESRKKLFKEKKPVTQELRMIDNAGEFKHVQYNIELILDENNQPSKIIGTVQDITERKKAEKRLLAALKREKQLVEELKISNLEQLTTKEELHVANEELQTTVEELKTANDRMMDSQIGLNNTIRQLKMTNSELGQFPYTDILDLHDPLTRVSNYTQILKLRYKGRLDEEADEYIDSIARDARQMKELLEKLKMKMVIKRVLNLNE